MNLSRSRPLCILLTCATQEYKNQKPSAICHVLTGKVSHAHVELHLNMQHRAALSLKKNSAVKEL